MVVFNNHGDAMHNSGATSYQNFILPDPAVLEFYAKGKQTTTWHEANAGFAQSKAGLSSSYVDLITILSQVGSDIISYSGQVGYYDENYPDDNWHSYKIVFNSIIKTIYKRSRCMGFSYKGYMVIASNPESGEILL